MIIHIALFKLKEDVEKQKIEDLLQKIKNLKVEGIRNIFAGENYHKYRGN